jgi:hypothetical protein
VQQGEENSSLPPNEKTRGFLGLEGNGRCTCAAASKQNVWGYVSTLPVRDCWTRHFGSVTNRCIFRVEGVAMVQAGLYRLPCTVAYDGPVSARSLAYWVVRAPTAGKANQGASEPASWEATFRGRRLVGQHYALETASEPEGSASASARPQLVVVGPLGDPDDDGWQPLPLLDATSSAVWFEWDAQSDQRTTLDQIAYRWQALVALLAPPSVPMEPSLRKTEALKRSEPPHPSHSHPSR